MAETQTEPDLFHIANVTRVCAAAGIILRDEAGRVLVVHPTYKDVWEMFDGGVLTPDQIATIRLCPDELVRYDFIEPERHDEVLIPRLARRVAAAVAAIGHGGVYLEDGRATASR